MYMASGLSFELSFLNTIQRDKNINNIMYDANMVSHIFHLAKSLICVSIFRSGSFPAFKWNNFTFFLYTRFNFYAKASAGDPAIAAFRAYFHAASQMMKASVHDIAVRAPWYFIFLSEHIVWFLIIRYEAVFFPINKDVAFNTGCSTDHFFSTKFAGSHGFNFPRCFSKHCSDQDT